MVMRFPPEPMKGSPYVHRDMKFRLSSLPAPPHSLLIAVPVFVVVTDLNSQLGALFQLVTARFRHAERGLPLGTQATRPWLKGFYQRRYCLE